MNKRTSVGFRCNVELKEDLERLVEKNTADGERPSLSKYLNILLTKHVKDKKRFKD